MHRIQVVAALIALSGTVVAQEGDASLKLQTERVVVYKDGYALVVKHGTGTVDEDGCVFTDQVPSSAVLGTFWATSEQTISGVRSERLDRPDTDVECTGVYDLLEANVGRHVRLRKGPWEAETLEGRLEKLAGDPAYGTAYAILAVARSGSEERVTVPVNQVGSVEGSDLATTVRRPDDSATGKRLGVEFANVSAGTQVDVRVMYFTPDVRWIPTYRIQGTMQDSVQMSLQGEILNELEDLSGVPLDLVVGVPHFRFRGTISPLALESQIVSALSQAAPQLMTQFASNSLSNGDFGNFGSRAGEIRGGAPEIPSELQGQAERDLHVFSIAAAPFPRGARRTTPLYEDDVEMRHLYTVELGISRDQSNMRYLARGPAVQTAAQAQGPNRPLVWHQLELINDSTTPWTTGAALILEERPGGTLLPLGQDLLRYTAPGSRTELPVTVAVGVHCHHDEEELSRDAAALTWRNSKYWKVLKKGTIRLVNTKPTAITMRVQLGQGGKVTRTSDSGAVTLDDFRVEDWNRDTNFRVNQHSDVTWEIELAAGTSKTLDYDFEYYIR